MRTKTVTRYYCDHCSKGMFKKPSMSTHEVICYRNAARKCLRCYNHPEYSISKERLKAIIEGGERCETEGGECPDCLMAAIIQHNTRPPTAWREGDVWTEYIKEQFQSDRRHWDEEHKKQQWGYM